MNTVIRAIHINISITGKLMDKFRNSIPCAPTCSNLTTINFWRQLLIFTCSSSSLLWICIQWRYSFFGFFLFLIY